jgi:uncharacterized protein (DUF952 family)
MPRLYHIASRTDWQEAARQGRYTADSLCSEGFIHCSEAHQVIRVANLRFRGRTDLLLLHIESAQLHADVRYENLEGGEELYPHIYGSLNLDAVVDITAFPSSVGGVFDQHRARLEA